MLCVCSLIFNLAVGESYYKLTASLLVGKAFSRISLVLLIRDKEVLSFSDRLAPSEFWPTAKRILLRSSHNGGGESIDIKKRRRLAFAGGQRGFHTDPAQARDISIFSQRAKTLSNKPSIRDNGSHDEKGKLPSPHLPRGNKKNPTVGDLRDVTIDIGPRQVRTKHLALYPCQTPGASGSQIPVVTRLL